MLATLRTSRQCKTLQRRAITIMELNEQEIHPIQLMRDRKWSYLELAIAFGVSEAEARKWGFRKTASNYRNPSKTAFILAGVLHKITA